MTEDPTHYTEANALLAIIEGDTDTARQLVVTAMLPGERRALARQAQALADHGIDTHTSKPLDQDLLGATWSAAPLSPEEIARAEAVGIDVGPLDSRLPAKWALIRQETARREAIAWVGDPHRHPGQFGARMCHDHDDFGYHCHDLAARPGAEPGRMYR